VTSNGVACQKYKSEKTVVASTELTVSLTDPVNGKRFGISDGTMHAYAIIEPGAAVYNVGQTSANSTGVNRTALPATVMSVRPAARARTRSRATSNRLCTGSGGSP